MIRTIGCETARELLESYVDNELPTDDQVAVQAHVQSCRVCAARVEDLSLIGWSLRHGTAAQPSEEDVRALGVVQSGVLTRIRAERAQAFRTRLGEMFADWRLVWPAIGASCAVIVCLCGTMNVWHLVMQKEPNSLAARLDAFGKRGTDSNPFPLDAQLMLPPRPLDDRLALGRMLEDDALLRIVVGTSGEVTEAELRAVAGVQTPVDAHQAVLDAVRAQRFEPAAWRGRRVAVEALLYYTHVNVPPVLREVAHPAPRPAPAPEQVVEPESLPGPATSQLLPAVESTSA